MNFKHPFLSLSIAALLMASCGDGTTSGTDSATEGASTEGEAPSTQLMEIEGKMFSFPSPVQTAFLIKEVGSNYDAAVLNDPASVNKYATSFSKSMNLGIYGADLGYVTIYEQTQDAISYLKAVKMLANDLGVAGAFDMALLERFEKNIGNKDSLLVLVGDAFRASDAYLKNNERSDVGALVLAGGWIESLYFTTMEAEKSGNKAIIDRIGAQKNTCKNLVSLLMPYYNKEEYTAFIDQLMELNDVFSGIESVYTYKEPTVDAANNKTIVNSTTEIRVSPEQLKDITAKVKNIRSGLIG